MNTYEELMNAYQEGYALTDPKLREERAKAKRDYDMDAKKMQLAKQLEMQIWQMKEEYSRQHPEYVHFAQTPEGITGFTKTGESKMMYQKSPDELAEDKKKQQLSFDLMEARINQAKQAAKSSEMNAQTMADYRKAMASKASRPPQAKVDESMIYQRNLNAALKEEAPPALPKFASDEEMAQFKQDMAEYKQRAAAKAMERTKAQVANMQSGAGMMAPPPNDFMNVDDSANQVEDDEEF